MSPALSSFVILRRSEAETGGPLVILRPIEDRTGGGAEGDLFRYDAERSDGRGRFALSRAAGSPGLRRKRLAGG